MGVLVGITYTRKSWLKFYIFNYFIQLQLKMMTFPSWLGLAYYTQNFAYYAFKYSSKTAYYIKTHSSVSAAKKTKEDMWHTCVLFTGIIKLPNSAFCISNTTKLISAKFKYFNFSLLHIKIEGIVSIFLEILILFVKIAIVYFFTFFFFTQNYKYICNWVTLKSPLMLRI